ncbi:hypothetical protein GQ457_03G007390 [Hibiscus cannabinus]
MLPALDCRFSVLVPLPVFPIAPNVPGNVGLSKTLPTFSLAADRSVLFLSKAAKLMFWVTSIISSRKWGFKLNGTKLKILTSRAVKTVNRGTVFAGSIPRIPTKNSFVSKPKPPFPLLGFTLITAIKSQSSPLFWH